MMPRRPSRCLLFCGIVLVGLFSATNALAQDQPQDQPPTSTLKQLSLKELSELEVTTTSKEPVYYRRVPAPMYVLTQDDIRRSGVTNIPDALRLVPGVGVARINSNQWAVGIRGFMARLSRAELALIDGRSVYTPLFAGVYWEVQDTLLEDIERIEVTRGPGGTIWGANAVNGIVNIITKPAKDTHGMLVSVGGGSFEHGFANFRYGGGNGRNVNYRVYGKAFFRDAVFHQDRDEFDDWGMGQGGFRSDWNLNQRDTLTLQGDIYRGYAGQRLDVSFYSPPSVRRLYKDAVLGGGNFMAKWHRALAGGSSFNLNAYYDRTRRSEPNFAETRNTFDIDFVHRIRNIPRHEVTWGLGARFSHGDSDLPVPTVVFTPEDFTEKLFTAYVQDEIALAPERVHLTVGTKILRNNYAGFDFQPSARLMWTPDERNSIWLAFTRAVRTTSRVEEDLELSVLTNPAGPDFVRFIGDGNFRSEKTRSYEGGFRTLLGSDVFLQVAAFHNEYRDLLSVETGASFLENTPAPPHNVTPLFIRNQVRGGGSGFEIVPTWRPSESWELKVGYSYLNLNFETRPGSTDATTVRSLQGSSPRHQFFAHSRWNLPRRVELDFMLRHVSALRAQSVGDYTTADARLGWRFTDRLELSLVGRDLLQARHAEFSGALGTQIRRSVYGKLTWRQ